MSYILTLIAGPGKSLGQSEIDGARGCLEGGEAEVGSVDWLQDGVAADVHFDSFQPGEMDDLLDCSIMLNGVDRAITYDGHRRKRLLIADMDSTMITAECIDELADFVGIKDEIALITERSMRGELDFPTALRERVGKLVGLEESVLLQCFHERIQLTNGARTLIQTMKSVGAYTALVSGGFTFFTQRVAEAIGFDENQANELNFIDGKLIGVKEPILDAEAKLKRLNEVCAEQAISEVQALAVGDGANDKPMIEAAGLGVAYKGKPLLQEAADVRLNHCGLDALLFVQGYHRDEFVTE